MKNFIQRHSNLRIGIQKKFIRIITLLSCLSILGSCLQQDSDLPLAHQYQPAELKADLEVFRGSLEDMHPALFQYLTRAKYDSLIRKVANSLDAPLTAAEFQSGLAEIVAAIRCGHTKIDLSENQKTQFWQQAKLFPYDLKLIGDRAYCYANMSDHQEINPGDEIISINGHSIPQLMELADAKISNDGYIQTRKMRFLERDFAEFYARYITQPDTFSIIYKHKNGQTNKTVTASINAAERYSRQTENQLAELSDHIALNMIDSLSAAVLTVTSFNNWEKNGSETDFKEELESSFRQVTNAGTQHLIIDLRNNGGGDDELGLALFSHLYGQPITEFNEMMFRVNKSKYFRYSDFNGFYRWIIADVLLTTAEANDTTFYVKDLPTLEASEPAKIQYDGKVYLLVNGRTFSTAADVAALLRSYKVAVIIGEETGGGYYGNSSGLDINVTLPASQLHLKIPTVQYQTNVRSILPRGRGTIPDVNISPTITDYLNQTDTALEYILNTINKYSDEKA
ncbi:MAG: S41 family peptidase [Cyclobacteriaceae bacterium]